MKKSFVFIAGVIFLAMFAASAHAAPFAVDAFANSTSGGTGVATISLSAGEQFTVTVNPADLWNAGDLPRWSNAGGLVANLYATGSDASGQPFGTLIGQNWGTWTQNGLTAPYGALVGQIGSGSFFLVGTSYLGTASAAGILSLYYFDSNQSDNSGKITANVSAVPLPSAVLLLAPGLLGLVGFRKRFKA